MQILVQNLIKLVKLFDAEQRWIEMGLEIYALSNGDQPF